MIIEMRFDYLKIDLDCLVNVVRGNDIMKNERQRFFKNTTDKT